jgi:hypothetical protein
MMIDKYLGRGMAKKNSDNDDDVEIKSSLVKEVEKFRSKWLAIVSLNELECYFVQGESERSPEKNLHLVKPGKWYTNFQREVNQLAAKIEKAGFVGRKKPRSLWLPTLIENAAEITIKAYQAKSIRRVSLEAAENFAKKNGISEQKIKEKIIDKGKKKRSIDSRTGINYKLRVVTADTSKVEYYQFSDWAVCLCSKNKQPEVNTETQEYTPKSEAKKTLCKSKDGKRVLVGWRKTSDT